MSDYDPESIFVLVAALRKAMKRKAAHYTPIARQLIRSRSANIQEIEHTLDHLLDVACIPEGLAPFEALCRYYFTLDPAASAEYTDFYRKMWDIDDDEEVEAET
jgi:hypothetical protein